MKTSLKAGFTQIFSCCPKNLSCPKFGGAAAPLAPPPARTPMRVIKYSSPDKNQFNNPKFFTLAFPWQPFSLVNGRIDWHLSLFRWGYNYLTVKMVDLWTILFPLYIIVYSSELYRRLHLSVDTRQKKHVLIGCQTWRVLPPNIWSLTAVKAHCRAKGELFICFWSASCAHISFFFSTISHISRSETAHLPPEIILNV